MKITIDGFKMNQHGFEKIPIQLKENNEWSSIEIIIENVTVSIPVQKFINILSLLVEEKETDNLRKQIDFIQKEIYCIKSPLVL